MGQNLRVLLYFRKFQNAVTLFFEAEKGVMGAEIGVRVKCR